MGAPSVTSPAQGLSGMCEGGESCELRMRAGTRSRGLKRRITGRITGAAARPLHGGSVRANPSGRLQGRAENASPGEGRGTPMCQAARTSRWPAHLERVSACQVNARAGEGEWEGEGKLSGERGWRGGEGGREVNGGSCGPRAAAERKVTPKKRRAALRAARMGFSVSLRVTGPFRGIHQPPEC